MSRRKKSAECPSCGSRFLKGRFVLRIAADGARKQRVCQTCAKLATLVLASDAPQICEQCHKEPARFCATCVAKVLTKAHQGYAPRKFNIHMNKPLDPKDWK